ncbi:hypothetical protein [Pseudomonas paralcaligenes]|uniref:hypothetical protein n=1 Tax=Pseudomonas paralcaligenes TaxID=2772558 RepID=UPI0021D34F22|nr:hypothetical protein [Pseudomonas paralcaligenes]
MTSVGEVDGMKKTTTQIVLDAVRELHSKQQIITRQTLVEVTGLKPGIVDDRLSVLVDDLLVLRVERGVFVPAPQHPEPRVITISQIPGGWAKIEVSDDYVLLLTPAEKRMMGELLAGAGQQFAAIDIGHQNVVIAAELAAKVRRLERELSAVRSVLSERESRQLSLLGEAT